MHVDLTNEQLEAMMAEARLSRFILVESDKDRDLSIRELYCAGTTKFIVVQVRRIRKC